jgi:hypothetical protein
MFKSRRMECVEHVARMGETGGVYKVLDGEREGKRPHERPRHRWEDNNKVDLGVIVWEGEDWIRLAQGADHFELVNMVMKATVCQKVENFLTS